MGEKKSTRGSSGMSRREKAELTRARRALLVVSEELGNAEQVRNHTLAELRASQLECGRYVNTISELQLVLHQVGIAVMGQPAEIGFFDDVPAAVRSKLYELRVAVMAAEASAKDSADRMAGYEQLLRRADEAHAEQLMVVAEAAARGAASAFRKKS